MSMFSAVCLSAESNPSTIGSHGCSIPRALHLGIGVRRGRVLTSDVDHRNETTRTHERQLQFLVYHLEAASLMADQAGVGKMMWLVDFVGYSFSTAPPVRISIQTVNILQVTGKLEARSCCWAQYPHHMVDKTACKCCYHA